MMVIAGKDAIGNPGGEVLGVSAAAISPGFRRSTGVNDLADQDPQPTTDRAGGQPTDR